MFFQHYPSVQIGVNLAFMDVILASQSPRRLFLLESAGLQVTVCPSHIDETALPGESIKAMTLRLCKEKAITCPMGNNSSLPVIAADTLVTVDGEVLGQPKDLIQAKVMIQKLSGKQHQVYTAVCVKAGDSIALEVVTTQVTFRDISEHELNIYLQYNEILDKAGAYAIQGGASSFITAIEGNLDNVIGLPVQQTLALLQRVAEGASAEPLLAGGVGNEY